MKNYSQHGPDEIFVILGIVIVVSLLAYVLITNFHYAALLWQQVRILEFSLVQWIPEWMPIYGDIRLEETLAFLKSSHYKELTPSDIKQFDAFYAQYFGWLPGIALVALGYLMLRNGTNVCRRWDTESLYRRQAKYFPHLKEFADVDMDKKEIIFNRDLKDQYAYMMQIQPSEFATAVPPYGLEKLAEKDSSLNQPIWDGDTIFDYDAAERSFKTQLGNKFITASKLSGVEKQLYDVLKHKLTNQPARLKKITEILIDSINSNKSDADGCRTPAEIRYKKYIQRYIQANIENKTKTNKKPKSILAGDIVKNKKTLPYIKDVIAESAMNSHAYVRTGLMTLLLEVRKSGVCPPFEFQSILKGRDRVLWYCISDVGRKVSVPESAGCFSHWLAERQVGRSLTKPEVTTAVEALKIALKIEQRIRAKQAKENF